MVDLPSRPPEFEPRPLLAACVRPLTTPLVACHDGAMRVPTPRRPSVPRWQSGVVALAALVWACATACSDSRDAGMLHIGRGYPPDPPGGAAIRLAPSDLDPGTNLLRLGLSPYARPDETRRDLAPLIGYLSQALGVRVELVIPASYGQLVADVCAGRVDIAMLSPLAYVQARQQNPGLQIAARAITQGSPEYSAYLVVRMDDIAQRLADLRGRRIAWVDPISASGYLYPRRVLIQAGIDPRRDLQSERFFGTHDAALRAVIEGEADVAAVASGALGRVCRPLDAGQPNSVRVLHKCGRLPYDAVVVRAGIGRVAVTKISWAFQALNNRSEAGRRILAGTWALSGWIPGDDSVYDGVRAHLDAHEPPIAATAAALAGLATEATDG